MGEKTSEQQVAERALCQLERWRIGTRKALGFDDEPIMEWFVYAPNAELGHPRVATVVEQRLWMLATMLIVENEALKARITNLEKGAHYD